LGGSISNLIAGFGLLEMTGTSIGGAMNRQLSEAWMRTKVGAEKAKEFSRVISEVNMKSPAPSSFIDELLSGAISKQTNITADSVRQLGAAASDYYIASMKAHKPLIEAQHDVIEYILTGNTAQLERDSIIKGQIDKLKDQATVEERIKALDEALRDAGYKNISNLDAAAIKYEEAKGRIEEQLIILGTQVLPVIEKILEVFNTLDATHGGLLSKALVIGGFFIAFTGSLGLIGGLLKMAFSPLIWAGGKLKDVISNSDKLRGALSRAKDVLSKLPDKAGEFASKVKDALPSLDKVKDKLSSIKDALSSVGDKAKDAFSRISLPDVSGRLRDAFSRIRMPDIRGRINVSGLSDLRTRLSDAISRSSRLSGAISRIRGIPGGVVSSFNRLKGSITGATSAQWGLNRVTLAGIGSRIKGAAVTAAGAAKNFLYGAASKIAAAGQWLLNAAMSANPLMIVLIAIVAVIGVLLYLWNTSEGFRKVVMSLWDKLKGLASFIRDVLVSAWNSVRDAIKWVVDKVLDLLKPLGDLKKLWDDVAKAIWDAVEALLGWNSTPAEEKGPGSTGGGKSGVGVGVGGVASIGVGGSGGIGFDVANLLAGSSSPFYIKYAGKLGSFTIQFPDLDPANIQKLGALGRAIGIGGAAAPVPVKVDVKTGVGSGAVHRTIVFEKGAIRIDARDKTEEEAARIVAKGLRYWTAKEALL